MRKFGAFQAQFNFTAGEAAFMAAAVAVPSAVLGTLFGSWAMKRFDMSATETLSFCKWVTFISIPMLLVFLVPCGSQEFAGVNIEYSPDPKGFFTSYNESLDFVSSLDAYCNLECNCINEDYFPVCGADNIQYYSPCHAGCTARLEMFQFDNLLIKFNLIELISSYFIFSGFYLFCPQPFRPFLQIFWGFKIMKK